MPIIDDVIELTQRDAGPLEKSERVRELDEFYKDLLRRGKVEPPKYKLPSPYAVVPPPARKGP